MGFSNANYALSEMDNPARTLRIAAPLALVTVTIFYLLCNIAYFSAVSKEDITGSGRLVAALLFRNVWGKSTERVLNAFVALSSLGNVLSVVLFQFGDGELFSPNGNVGGPRHFHRAALTKRLGRREFFHLAKYGHPIGLRKLLWLGWDYVGIFHHCPQLAQLIKFRLVDLHHCDICRSTW